jgi:hypothetical protein
MRAQPPMRGRTELRQTLFWTGVAALILGLVWIGQGTGVFPYPRESFMIGVERWTWIGLAVASGGLIAIVLSRFMRP